MSPVRTPARHFAPLAVGEDLGERVLVGVVAGDAHHPLPLGEQLVEADDRRRVLGEEADEGEVGRRPAGPREQQQVAEEVGREPEELGADVNIRDNDGYTALHHAAARGDNEMILYLVSKGADVKVVSRNGRTTADMANGPVSRISPFPDTIALLVKLGAINNNRCQSCAP